jgi:hypothetical protein
VTLGQLLKHARLCNCILSGLKHRHGIVHSLHVGPSPLVDDLLLDNLPKLVEIAIELEERKKKERTERSPEALLGI